MIRGKIGSSMIGDGFQGKLCSENGCLTGSRGGRHARGFPNIVQKTVLTDDGVRPYGQVPYHKLLNLLAAQARNSSRSGLIDLLKDLTTLIKRSHLRQDCHVSAL